MPRRAEGAGAGEAVADLGSWEDEAGRAVAAATAPSAGGSPVSESSEEGEAAEYPDAWDAENVEEESVWASDDADEPGSSSYPADLSESLSSLTRTRAMSWRTSSGKEGGLWWRLDECEGGLREGCDLCRRREAAEGGWGPLSVGWGGWWREGRGGGCIGGTTE